MKMNSQQTFTTKNVKGNSSDRRKVTPKNKEHRMVTAQVNMHFILIT